jgi:NAD-specific glutamate dehydrogenase
VLADNFSQSLAVSLDERARAEALDDFRDLITALEKVGMRSTGAPRSCRASRAWCERQEAGKTLTRPELVRAARARQAVGERAGPEEPAARRPVLRRYLAGYFPPRPSAARAARSCCTAIGCAARSSPRRSPTTWSI